MRPRGRPAPTEGDVAFGDLKLVGLLKTKMHWHEARQQLLAENVANADTPSYRPKDLKPPRFEAELADHIPSLRVVRTNAMHIASAAQAAGGDRFRPDEHDGWEQTPAGNAVILEEEMMKVAANQFDFQLASSLYSKSVGLIRTALGRK